jgi:hypothetical protein
MKVTASHKKNTAIRTTKRFEKQNLDSNIK